MVYLGIFYEWLEFSGNVAALVRSHMNGLQLFESTIEQITETMPPSQKTITAAAMTTNRITSLRELLHYRNFLTIHTVKCFKPSVKEKQMTSEISIVYHKCDKYLISCQQP